MLLRGVGLTPEYQSTNHIVAVSSRRQGGLLPGRYRSRILRLLLPLLINSTPSEAVVRGILGLAGSTSSAASGTIEEDDSLVSRGSGIALEAPSRPFSNAVEKLCQPSNCNGFVT